MDFKRWDIQMADSTGHGPGIPSASSRILYTFGQRTLVVGYQPMLPPRAHTVYAEKVTANWIVHALHWHVGSLQDLDFRGLNYLGCSDLRYECCFDQGFSPYLLRKSRETQLNTVILRRQL
jgi:hypothetical protein